MINPIHGAFFGRTIDCECGRTHEIEPREVYYATDAVERLPQMLAPYAEGRAVAVLMDRRTRAAAGEAAANALAAADWRVLELVVPDPREGLTPVCDGQTHDALLARLGTPDIILTVGGGVIGDLGKWMAHDRAIPYVSFATAASMNGYASANVAPTIQGIKTLIHARPPKAVVADPAVLRDAPYELTTAGLGDILAKSVSSADWYLNHLLFDDFFCPRSVSLIAEIEPLYMDRPEDLREGRPDAIEALFQGLVLTGVAMTMAGGSAPASGGEHLVSHTLDMLAARDGIEHDLHGRQVGIGTILASELYRRVLALESPEFNVSEQAVDRPFWGAMAGEVSKQSREKADRLLIARDKLARGCTWDGLREQLAPLLRPPEQLRDCLRRAGAACRVEDIGCDRARLREAFLHAHEMRSRFTILDLARIVGLMPHAAAEIVEAWA